LKTRILIKRAIMLVNKFSSLYNQKAYMLALIYRLQDKFIRKSNKIKKCKNYKYLIILVGVERFFYG